MWVPVRLSRSLGGMAVVWVISTFGWKPLLLCLLSLADVNIGYTILGRNTDVLTAVAGPP